MPRSPNAYLITLLPRAGGGDVRVKCPKDADPTLCERVGEAAARLSRALVPAPAPLAGATAPSASDETTLTSAATPADAAPTPNVPAPE